MKTTFEIPDSLFRQAKVKAAMDGRKMKELVAEGLTLVLAQPGPAALQPLSAAQHAQSPHETKRSKPSWYGVLAPYARRAQAGSDMKSIRASIARGLATERQL